MKLVLLFLFVATVAAVQVDQRFKLRHGLPPAKAPNSKAIIPSTGYITQRLDNFDPLNQRTWSMRYIKNGQFFKSGGPIFIMLGAEWTIDEGWLMSGQMFDMAVMHNAYMYYTEHRYYGHSHPTEDLTTENLRYLTADQALADVAHFIIQMKKENPELANSKVVVFGGSYGATMATWMRQKYPHLVHAAVASSAPLLAKVDYYEYHDVVKNNLWSECSRIFMNGTREIRRLIANGQKEKVDRDFALCWPMQNEMDYQVLFLYIANIIAGEIQYADQRTVETICTKLNNPDYPTDYDKLVAYYNTGYCIGNYDYTLNSYKYVALTTRMERQWFYQTCTNFGFFQTAWGEDSLYNYGMSVELYHKQCQDVFGSNFTRYLTHSNVESTNLQHGALSPRVTRVISTHGTVDPWHSLGLPASTDYYAPVIIIPGASHCADMHSLEYWPSEEIRQAQLAVLNYVNLWLQED